MDLYQELKEDEWLYLKVNGVFTKIKKTGPGLCIWVSYFMGVSDEKEYRSQDWSVDNMVRYCQDRHTVKVTKDEWAMAIITGEIKD